MQVWKEYLEENKDRFLEELVDLLKIPSISADSAHKDDMLAAAKFVENSLTKAGCDTVEVCDTPGHPIVYGEKIIDASLPTILIYGHYDVQPADPLELWDSPPFEPVIKDGKIYARGACDDKGQVYMHVKALEVLTKTDTLQCNVKFMIEGEEEVGSPNLGPWINANKEKLSCDVVLVSDTSMISMEHPSIETGLRGLAYLQVEVTGPNRDLHSGVYGGGVGNPINILCKMIASLQDEDNRITIPAFYDKVVDLTDQEREELNKAPFDLEEYQKELGIEEIRGEKGYTTLERTGVRPTLDVNGIWGGYTGAPKSVKVTVKPDHGGEPVVTPTDSVAYQAAAKAIVETFGKSPIPTRGGGSIPIVALFEEALNVKTVLLGFGLDSDNIHSPNEKFDLFNYYKGIETLPHFHKYFKEMEDK